jgi:hypothetical protein
MQTAAPSSSGNDGEFLLNETRRPWLCFDNPVNGRKRYPSDLSDERWALI